MKVKTQPFPRESIEHFADKHDLTMVVAERGPDFDGPKWYAQFEGCEVKEGNILRGEFGNGSNPKEAITDYVGRISGKLLVFGAYTNDRKEIRAPILYYRQSQR